VKPAARIARLEVRAHRLATQIRQAQGIYCSDRLDMARAHVLAALADLQIAKIGATPRAPWRETR
jgi:hypothetical protein